ncbi:1-phosphofructokinase [Porcipelethomonas sp.]|uniref:1-phosphofructokinase n=1 Tax=Porcipelethomonas sp. TaxID=2981675 RepID=UPI003EF5AFF2
MIYTVTFNPALDYALISDEIKLGFTNRSKDEYLMTGGKGINVSAMLSNLEIENTALGFIGGFTGQEIKKRVLMSGCNCDFIEVDGLSRINVKIKSDAETEINASGPKIEKKDIELLINKVKKLHKGDYLVLAGSVGNGVSDEVYSDIMKNTDKEVKIVVDAAGKLLLNAIKEKPFLIKPNNFELSQIAGTDIGNNRKKALEYADVLHEMGAENVLVSFAGNGAAFSSVNGLKLESEAPKGTVIDSVGAGDSMVAGFIAGWTKNQDYTNAFRMGIAAGSASAFSKGFASKEKTAALYNTINKICIY